MENNQPSNQNYLYINGERVAVSEEYFLTYMRLEWAEEKRREREKRCRDINGIRCMKDCSKCGRDRTGLSLSLEQFAEDGFDVADPNDPEKIVMHKFLIEALHIAIRALEPKDYQIAMMLIGELSEREIAAKVGISQVAVNKRKRKIYEKLRERLKEYR